MSSKGSPVEAYRRRLNAAGMRVAVVSARFNHDITDRLLDGARSALLTMPAPASA